MQSYQICFFCILNFESI